MINSYFGIAHLPFILTDTIHLLAQQQDVYDIVKVHCHQGGLCVIMGEAGTGKSVIKETIRKKAEKTMVTATVGRTLHTYTNTIKLLCQAFNIEWDGTHFKCEKRIIEQAYALYREGKTISILIDDAHLMEIPTLRRIRLMLEDFPKNHNLILFGQPGLMAMMALKVNDDIKSRITFSATLRKLISDDMRTFMLSEFDKVALGHNTFTDEAIDLITRSTDGILRRAKNLCLGTMLEAVRQQKRTITLDIVNKVLIQPHWRTEFDNEQMVL